MGRRRYPLAERALAAKQDDWRALADVALAITTSAASSLAAFEVPAGVLAGVSVEISADEVVFSGANHVQERLLAGSCDRLAKRLGRAVRLAR
jgi:hypothetical protein